MFLIGILDMIKTTVVNIRRDNYDIYIGQKFGRLTVIQQIDNKWGHLRWLCRCDCGKEKIIYGHNLNNNRTKSCGCLQKEIASTINQNNQYNFKHGYSQNNRTYQVWHHIKQRCTNPNDKGYKNYGGRGITICKRWFKFENFFKDMEEQPNGYSIDRIDNNQGYYKENCRWVTPKQNNRNKRTNHLETYNGKTQCLTEWAEETGISKQRIEWRLKHGWSIEKTLTTPVKKYKRSRRVSPLS